CGTKAAVQSFLTAAQQTCSRCGQLLMGALSAGGRTIRPPGFDGPLPSFPGEQGRSKTGIWIGMFVGVFLGIGIVAAMAYMQRTIPLQTRGAMLGALMGVLLAPVIMLSSFLSMIILPFSLEGILGDSMWSRLARANNERRLGPLFMPFLIYVGGPMTLCGWG